MTRSDHLRLTVICATWLGDGKSGNTCTLICLNELGYERLGMFSQWYGPSEFATARPWP